MGQEETGDGGEFSDGFGLRSVERFVGRRLREERGAGEGEVSGEEEPGEGATDVATGANALDDLLSEVAAFGEVEGAGRGAGGGGLLREFAVADVDAEQWSAFEEAECFERGSGGLDGSCFEQSGGEESDDGGFSPELEAGDERAVGVNEVHGGALPEVRGQVDGGC